MDTSVHGGRPVFAVYWPIDLVSSGTHPVLELLFAVRTWFLSSVKFMLADL
jgi:hypothetical protein